MAGYIPPLNIYAMLSGLGDTLNENSDHAAARQQQQLEQAALQRLAGGDLSASAPQPSGNIFGNILSGVQNTLAPAPAAAPPGLQPAATIAPGQNMAGGPQNDVEAYIRQAAAQRGIDPEIALKVAKSEGLNSYTGDQGSSFGPFQLHYGGVAQGGNRVAGMGDDFTKATGLDARDPKTVNAQIDFALDQAKKGGWGPWHGAANSGIAPMQGIGQSGRVQLAGPVPTPDSAAPAQPQAAPAAGGDYQVNGRKYTMQDALIFAQSKNPGTAALGKAMLGKIMEGSNRITNVTDPTERAGLGLASDDKRLVQRDNTGKISIVDTAPKEAKRTAEGDVVEREKIANQRGMQGADREFYILNGKLPTSSEKAPTEGQANAALYADRMREANAVISDPKFAAAGASGVQKGLAALPLAGNYLISPEKQQIEQAKSDFVNAVLRRESGAAISPSEFANADRQYFPQPGDGPAVIAQKAKNRETALQGVANAAGPAYAKRQAAAPAQAEKPVPEKQSAPQPKLGSVPIPMGAAGYLKENPNLRDAFDLKYGAGAAEKVLGPAR